jgi:hypothetical protein
MLDFRGHGNEHSSCTEAVSMLMFSMIIRTTTTTIEDDFYCCTVHVVIIAPCIPTHAHTHTLKH